MEAKRPCLISIVGPTAIGKTKIAIEVAKEIGVDIISADSRQFYREMEIGTAKPTSEELKIVTHHFINSHSIYDSYSAGKFEIEALKLLETLFEKNKYVVSVGGSGLYFKALWEGFDEMPDVAEHIRLALNSEFKDRGLKGLLEELKANDPVYYHQVDRQNHHRIIRALEVIRSTGIPFSAFRKNKPRNSRFFTNLKFGLETDLEQLNERIDARMDQMISNGLFEEVEGLYENKHLSALQTVGYKEIFQYMDGKYDREQTIRLLKRNSRRYAKRQMTWFKTDKEILWLNVEYAKDKILDFLQTNPQN